MLERLTFVVAEDPVPKGRPRFGGGRAFTPARTAAYEKVVRAAAQEAMVKAAWEPKVARYAVRLVIVSQDAKARDIENVSKSLFDGMNPQHKKVDGKRVVTWPGVYPDDSMVDALAVERWAPDEGGGFVFVVVDRVPSGLLPWRGPGPMLGWSGAFYAALDSLDG